MAQLKLKPFWNVRLAAAEFNRLPGLNDHGRTCFCKTLHACLRTKESPAQLKSADPQKKTAPAQNAEAVNASSETLSSRE